MNIIMFDKRNMMINSSTIIEWCSIILFIGLIGCFATWNLIILNSIVYSDSASSGNQPGFSSNGANNGFSSGSGNGYPSGRPSSEF